MAKVTFTVDDETVRTLRTMSERLGKPQSMVVREAVAEYGARAGRLTEVERRRLLTALDAIMKRPATRPQPEVDRELKEIRRARRHGGRRRRLE
jgi:predicted transcriptional regulator